MEKPTEHDIYQILSRKQTSPHLDALLNNPSFLPNQYLKEFKTRPLNIAVSSGNLETIMKLLKKGADPGANINLNNTLNPMYHAILMNRPDIIRVLVDAGADVNAKIKNSPLISIAAAKSNVGTVQTLLDSKSTLMFAENEYKETPLITAVQHQNPASVALLLLHMRSYELSHRSHAYGDKSLPKRTALQHAKERMENSDDFPNKHAKMIYSMIKAATPKKSFLSRIGF